MRTLLDSIDLDGTGRLVCQRLAWQIGHALAAAEEEQAKALYHVRHVGEMLREAKARLPHGEFGAWVRTEFKDDFSYRTARDYMRVAKVWNRLTQNGSALPESIRQAIEVARELDGTDEPEPAEAHWKGMPEFEQEDLTPHRTAQVHFRSDEDVEAFEEKIGGKLRHGKWTWYPPEPYGRYRDRRYVGGSNPRYPVYIISKGRWERPLTAKALERMGVPYRIVVEPQEHEKYAAVIASDKILTPPFSNLGQGSIPARNWVWEHSLSEGQARHWILDDNIDGFYRLNRNAKRAVESGASFRAIEEFVDRYENVALAGMHYESFVKRREQVEPVLFNTRVYSCTLIKNDLPYRWRGRYNEDTDLSLRVLKDGWATVLFRAFLANKVATMTMSGGNTDELYRGDGRLKMAESLQAQHPDVVRVTEKWGRPQHQVDYRPFANNRLVLREGVEIPEGTDEFGMALVATNGQGPEEQPS